MERVKDELKDQVMPIDPKSEVLTSLPTLVRAINWDGRMTCEESVFSVDQSIDATLATATLRCNVTDATTTEFHLIEITAGSTNASTMVSAFVHAPMSARRLMPTNPYSC